MEDENNVSFSSRTIDSDTIINGHIFVDNIFDRITIDPNLLTNTVNMGVWQQEAPTIDNCTIEIPNFDERNDNMNNNAQEEMFEIDYEHLNRGQYNELSEDYINGNIIDINNSVYGGRSSLQNWHSYNRDFYAFALKSEMEDLENHTKTTYDLVPMGTELEMVTSNGNSSKSRYINFLNKNLYCITASDSSIEPDGLELISDVFTFNAWLSLKRRLKQVFSALRRDDVISDSDPRGTCGLHVHVSREALGKTEDERKHTIENINLLIVNFKDELEKFSRRRSQHYCQYGDIVSYSADEIQEMKAGAGRYAALNEENEHTIEFRIFRGTLNISTYIATLQLVYNIVTICRNDDKLKNLTWRKLITENNFDELKAYNNIKGIYSRTRFKNHTMQDRLAKQKAIYRKCKHIEKQNEYIDSMQEYIKENKFLIALVSALDMGINHGTSNDLFRSIFGEEDCYMSYSPERDKFLFSAYSEYRHSLQAIRRLFEEKSSIYHYVDYETGKPINLRYFEDEDFEEIKKGCEFIKKLILSMKKEVLANVEELLK